ncbi:MAG TPA: thiamine diphosphokinase [Candidatus Thermoplasmatota archaeon]|nr:thiamine diphosphokinase [Candidatus Thermoplasmatota archaeon]
MHGVLVFPRATAALVAAHVPRDAKLVAVDGGAEACLDAGIVPALVVGDMDSVSQATLAALVARGARVERHPSAKRDTDAALALAHMKDCDDVLFLGAGGGRADHALANLHLLAEVALRADARAIDEDAETWIATPARPLTLHLPSGALVSMIPFDAEVRGIAYEGLRYPLHDATMRAGDPYGVSNEAVAPMQRISVSAGRLIVMRPLLEG